MRAKYSASSLRTLFLSALSIAGPIPLLAATSCSADPQYPPVDHSSMNLDACPPDNPVQGVKAGNPVDYVALYNQALTYEGGKVVPSGEPVVTGAEGTACAQATNQAACLQALGSIRVTSGLSGGCLGCTPSASYLAYTRRDEVGTVTTREALASFLAPVADVKSAAFLVRQNGYTVACTGQEHNARVSGDGFDFIARTGGGCGTGDDITEYIVHVSKAAQITVQQSVIVQRGDPQCTYGRKPEGFDLAGPSGDASPLGRFFAEAAELEAASVPAFLRLAKELAEHGAPAELVERARSAARDEIRHTAMMTSLARRFGAEPSTPEVPHRPARSLFDMALENAVEGCVHETFAALQATHQARHAGDARIRKVMQRIAEDETRHGALAWNVAEWAEPLLTDGERARIEQARREAAASLMSGLAEPHRDVVLTAGAPSAAQASRLLHAVAGELWAA